MAESRLLSLKIVENIGEVGRDTFDRYIKNPVVNGHPEKLLFLPIAIINGTARLIDGVIAGAADVELPVPNGTLGEAKRDLKITRSHLLPPKPLKLLTDVIRLPGTFVSGFLDAAAGFDTRHEIARTLNA